MATFDKTLVLYLNQQTEVTVLMSTIFDKPNISDFLLQYRKKNHLTRKMFAEIIGIEVHTLWRWENGYSTPSIPSLTRLSDATGETFTTLFHLSRSDKHNM